MITVTNIAKTYMRDMLDLRGRGKGIRVGVKSTGCSGYAYVIEYADTINENDTLVDLGDLNIIIDKKSEILLRGSEIDFVEGRLGSGIKFTNPNSKSVCGCGESFTV